MIQSGSWQETGSHSEFKCEHLSRDILEGWAGGRNPQSMGRHRGTNLSEKAKPSPPSKQKVRIWGGACSAVTLGRRTQLRSGQRGCREELQNKYSHVCPTLGFHVSVSDWQNPTRRRRQGTLVDGAHTGHSLRIQSRRKG